MKAGTMQVDEIGRRLEEEKQAKAQEMKK